MVACCAAHTSNILGALQHVCCVSAQQHHYDTQHVGWLDGTTTLVVWQLATPVLVDIRLLRSYFLEV